jgi:hypothetical protein
MHPQPAQEIHSDCDSAGHCDTNQRPFRRSRAERLGYRKAVTVDASSFISGEDGCTDKRDQEISDLPQGIEGGRECRGNMQSVRDEADHWRENQGQCLIRKRPEDCRPPD